MDSSSLFISPLFSLLLLFLFLHLPTSLSFNTTTTHPPPPPKCHPEERNALLEFKANFYNEPCYDGDANLTTWTVEDNNGDCCNWSGVVCDQHSRHVIGLELDYSCLSGSINSSSTIFKLTHLQTLDLSYNDFRYSTIPSAISNLSRLEYLILTDSNFFGQIPSEILNLTNLSFLDLSSSNEFYSNEFYFNQNHLTLKNPNLRDLVQSLLKLESLYLDSMEISSSLPDSLSRLTSLRYLHLSDCKLQGQVPPSVANLTTLENLDLSNNQFTGEIFPHLLTLTNLQSLYLSSNKFSGQIPRTISHLKKLASLFLDSNDFSGKIHLDVFLQLDSLEVLYLSYNDLSSSVIDGSSIKPRSKFLYHLSLASCNLKSFPLLLQGLDGLGYLDLSSNDIFGEVPQWFMDVTMGNNLFYLNLSHNHLSGSLPIPSTNSSLQYYIASNNEFSGELPMRMCNLVNITFFDIGNNNMSGMIPQCLANLVGMGYLFVLNLQNNSFNGPIPQFGKITCNLAMIDMSYNQLEGPVPRHMENCSNLEFLNLGNNKINDFFPFWLGKLPRLSMLILCSNRFHGIIGKPFDGYEFPKLQIINLFNNNFTGCLPTQYFEGWMAMKVDAHKEDRTMSYASFENISYRYFYAVVMTSKGTSVEYTKIPMSLVGIDLSSNYFTGEIPKSVATLKGLRFLDLSNNILTGSIPSNLNGLLNLESLDLSHNKLSGELPQQLTDLTTLEYFDVSFNQLTGPIPQSKQFNTFDNSSYRENSGLCGFPLSRKCGNGIEESPPPSLEKDHALKMWIEFDWKIVSMGYSCGIVFGAVMGLNWTRRCKRVRKFCQIRFILS